MPEMHPFERQVANDAVRRMGPTRPVDDLAIFESVRTQPRGSRFAPLFDATRFATAAVVVLLFGGFLVTAFLISQPEGDRLPAGVVSSPSSSPTQTQTGPDPVASPQETPVRPRTAIPTAIATASLLATVAPTALAQEGIAGYTIEPLVLTERPLVGADDVIALPDGRWLAFGGGYLKPGDRANYRVLHWSSDDDGQTWTETIQKQRFGSGTTVGIVPHGDQFVAAVDDDVKDSYDTWIYTSPDGGDWQRAARLKNVDASDLISTPDGLALLGNKGKKVDGWGKKLAPHPTLWLSSDAVAWEPHEITGPPASKKDADSHGLETIIRTADGSWVAAGSGERWGDVLSATPSIWMAGDDLVWTEIPSPLPVDEDRTLLHLMSDTPAGLLFRAVDTRHEGDDVSLWTTTDGADWQQVAQLGAHPAIDGVVVTDTNVLGFKLAVGNWPVDPQLLPGSPVYAAGDGTDWQQPAQYVLDGYSVDSVSTLPDGRLLIVGNDITGCENWECVAGTDGQGEQGTRVHVTLIATPT